MRWAVHEACMGEMRSLHKILAEEQEKKDRLVDLGEEIRTILRDTIICTRHRILLE